MNDWQLALRGYSRFAMRLAVVTLVLLAAGIPLSRALAGAAATRSLLAAAAVGLCASLVSGLPLLVTVAKRGAASTASLLGSLGIRFFVVLVASAAIAFSGAVEPRSFLIWVGISYLAYLIADVRYALSEQATSRL